MAPREKTITRRQKQREREFEEGIMDAGNRAMQRLQEELGPKRK